MGQQRTSGIRMGFSFSLFPSKISVLGNYNLLHCAWTSTGLQHLRRRSLLLVEGDILDRFSANTINIGCGGRSHIGRHWLELGSHELGGQKPGVKVKSWGQKGSVGITADGGGKEQRAEPHLCRYGPTADKSQGLMLMATLMCRPWRELW